MNLAVVGSRDGADIDDLLLFITALHRKHPETVIISGGADGVDTVAEQGWLRLGGRVVSFRPKQTGPEEYGIERWQLAPAPQVCSITVLDITFGGGLTEDGRRISPFSSAALYRDCLIADTADRLVAFQKKGGSRGTSFTADMAKAKEIPVSLYFPDKRFAA